MKAKVMSAKELDAFCEKAGLTNADWDEGGGYIHEAVVRVITEARLAERKEVIDSFAEAEIHSNPNSALKAFYKVLKEWKSKLEELGFKEGK